MGSYQMILITLQAEMLLTSVRRQGVLEVKMVLQERHITVMTFLTTVDSALIKIFSSALLTKTSSIKDSLSGSLTFALK